MPSFLPSLNELRGFAISLNPINVFSSPEPLPESATPTPTATAGPGPSTLANSASLNSFTRPALRPALSSASHPLEDGATARRRSTVSNVVIAVPEKVDDGLAQDRPKGKRRDRPLSVISGTAESTVETRRRKKVPWDTYIVVKPPPTTSKNPLNLQIQLLVKPDPRTPDRSASYLSTSTRSASISTDITTLSPSPQNLERPSIEPKSPTVDVAPSSDEAVVTLSDSPPIPSSSGAANLKRSSSVKSSGSLDSSSASTASGFGGGQKRRVEPMFNLAVHSVMQSTIVTDAATDAKVAKFLKRTLDIAGVGVLEPSEVWHPTSHMASTTNLFTSSSTSDDGHLPAGRSGRPHSIVSSLTSPLSPTSTRTDSQDRSSFDTKKPSLDLRRLNPAGMMGLEGDGGGKTKQFFGKIFKKKAPQELDAPQPALGRRISPTPSYNSMESTLPPPNPGMNGHHPVLHVKAPSTASASITTEHPHGSYAVGHPTFGTAPLIVHRRSSGTIVTSEGAVTGLTGPISLGLSLSNSSAISADRATALPMLPSTKPVGYTWTVRKWAKKNTDGWAAHLVAAAAAGLEMVNGAFTGEADDEVVFEWVKMRAPFGAAGSSLMRRYSAAGTIASNRARSRSRGGSTLVPNGHTESPSPPRAPVSLAPPKRADSPLPPSSPLPSPKLDSRPEPVRRVSASTSPASKAESASETELIAEEGDDSDPEDSETPWACSIWVKKTGHRQLLGTLTPAPHHPKVIGVLKIPMGLDPVALTDVQGTGARQQEMASKVREEVSLAEENLKDVVCVTAMWLVAREEFGGLGKKRKV